MDRKGHHARETSGDDLTTASGNNNSNSSLAPKLQAGAVAVLLLCSVAVLLNQHRTLSAPLHAEKTALQAELRQLQMAHNLNMVLQHKAVRRTSSSVDMASSEASTPCPTVTADDGSTSSEGASSADTVKAAPPLLQGVVSSLFGSIGSKRGAASAAPAQPALIGSSAEERTAAKRGGTQVADAEFLEGTEGSAGGIDVPLPGQENLVDDPKTGMQMLRRPGLNVASYLFGCLERRSKGDRLKVVARPADPSAMQFDLNETDVAFLAQDLCAMGHTTKDAAHLMSYIMDQVKLGDTNAISTLVYGHYCMTKPDRSQSSFRDKRTPVFHNVLLDWFNAVREGIYSLTGKRVRVLFAEEIREGSAKCFNSVAVRDELFRWFRTQEQAFAFRRTLLKHYRVPFREQTLQRPAPPLKIVILRRDEDRHFNESAVYAYLQSVLDKSTAMIEMHTFDKVRGNSKPPPTHPEQLRILHGADVLIAAHGAGLAGIAAMRPGTAAIELFPHNFRYYMYHELALLMGVHYFAIESPVVWPKRCCVGRGIVMPRIKSSVLEMNGIGARACKKCDIYWPPEDMMMTLRTAMNAVRLHQQTTDFID